MSWRRPSRLTSIGVPTLPTAPPGVVPAVRAPWAGICVSPVMRTLPATGLLAESSRSGRSSSLAIDIVTGADEPAV